MPQLMKAPKAQCPGSECPGCSSASCYAKGGDVKGVNKPFEHGSGKSEAGVKLKPAFSLSPEWDRAKAKDQHRQTLSEMKEMPKPNLYSKGGNVKGVHTSPDWQPEKGKSYAGTAQRAGNTSRNNEEKEFQHGEAKDSHREVLSEMKSMKKPNLYAEGGEVDGSEHDDMDGELNDMMGEELLHAFESKDKKKIMSCIEAAVLSCMNKE